MKINVFQASFTGSHLRLAICGVTGIFVTYFFVPDMTGVDLEDEDRKFIQYLSDNGWTGLVGEDETESSIEGDDEKQFS